MVFTAVDIVIISFIFIWIGFVRTGLGFGGAVLGLPLLMLVGWPLVRIMVECADNALATESAKQISEAIKSM